MQGQGSRQILIISNSGGSFVDGRKSAFLYNRFDDRWFLLGLARQEKSSKESIVANNGSELWAGSDVFTKARETDANIVVKQTSPARTAANSHSMRHVT